VRQAVARRRTEGVGRRDEAGTRRPRQRREQRAERRVADDDGSARIADDVFELGGRMRNRQRHGNASCAPDAALHGGIGTARRHEECDTRLIQIFVVGKERPCHAARGLIELVIGEPAVRADDRRTLAHAGE
jgi:hypothetical protein